MATDTNEHQHYNKEHPSDPPVNPSGAVYQYYLMTGAYEPDTSDGEKWKPLDHEGGEIPEGTFGNILGLKSKLKDIQAMGFDTVWVGPVPTSNIKTGDGYGYDAVDYDNVNPTYGTNDHFIQMVEEAHDLGLNIILDQVYNHTSIEHDWFQQSLAARTSESAQNKDSDNSQENLPPPQDYKDYYIWQKPLVSQDIFEGNYRNIGDAPTLDIPLRDSKGQIVMQHDTNGNKTEKPVIASLKPLTGMQERDDGTKEWGLLLNEDGKLLYPPNNFMYIADGSTAWEYVEETGECYMHTFHKSMPDLNIGNPDVNKAIINSATKWVTEKGADGFRLDASAQAGAHWSVRMSNEALYHSIVTESERENLETSLPELELSQLEELFQSVTRLPSLANIEVNSDYSALTNDQKEEFSIFAASLSSNPPSRTSGLGANDPFLSEAIIMNARAEYSHLKNLNDEDTMLYLAATHTEEELEQINEQQSGSTGLMHNASYREQLHMRDTCQPSAIAFWKEFNETITERKETYCEENNLPYRAPSMIFENGDNWRGMGQLKSQVMQGKDSAYMSTFDNVHNPRDIRTAIEKLSKHGIEGVSQGIGFNFTFSNHDTTRIVSRMGIDDLPKDEREAATKLLHKTFSRIPGTFCVYNGEETGRPSVTGYDIANCDYRNATEEEHQETGKNRVITDKRNDVFNYLSDHTAFLWRDEAGNHTHDFDRINPWGHNDFDLESHYGGQQRFFKPPETLREYTHDAQKGVSGSILTSFEEALTERKNDVVLSDYGYIDFLDHKHGDDVLIYMRYNNAGNAHIYVDNYSNKEIEVDLQDFSTERNFSELYKDHLLSHFIEHCNDDLMTVGKFQSDAVSTTFRKHPETKVAGGASRFAALMADPPENLDLINTKSSSFSL